MKRQCGTCTLCCRLVPVRELEKPAGARCKFQRHTGCQVYHRPNKGFPHACGFWSCKWLLNDDAADLSRPDRAGYVLDITPDFVTITDDGVPRNIQVVQIWCDPKRPDAHRDPALRAWLERRYLQNNVLGLVRYDNKQAIALFPPASAPDGQWHEVAGSPEGLRPEHSIDEVAAALGGEMKVVLELEAGDTIEDVKRLFPGRNVEIVESER
jgi:hypothetical protein